MRNMSFSMTTEAVRRGEKFVTRRLAWWNLEPGEVLMAVEKSQGLKKGEHVVRIRPIIAVSVRAEKLDTLRDRSVYPDPELEMAMEGFPGMSVRDFITMFCRGNGIGENMVINRIVLAYPVGP
jgi:hypothetical protein